ncbi:arfGAP with SH3 domain, ANK repeat and PH domain-containing protein [Caerostris darwini]|uniref:ArfGAP with SH3 domain, ANK repeat and PH domain-containing protein n=1 Tax=Caerostris darwini TaxID=1538125 RepID=A0AAV4QQK1_9ARAC|nr:arfGAP with SH3 domain, ANK repeat and PH domain-containing protein [Caerostris darwini]
MLLLLVVAHLGYPYFCLAPLPTTTTAPDHLAVPHYLGCFIITPVLANFGFELGEAMRLQEDRDFPSLLSRESELVTYYELHFGCSGHLFPQGGQVTPEHLNRSRPSSVVGNESPTSRSSSISETVKQSPLVTPRTMPPPPPPQNKKPFTPGAKQVLPKTCEFPVLKSVEKPLVSNTGSLQRPKCPPPPTPPVVLNETVETLSNGQSSDSLPQSCDSNSSQSQTPVPPPRKRHDTIKSRRCRALYDCDADREDELSFKEGEIITIISEVTDDDDWMEGMIEGQPERRGVFPSSFVHVLKD